MKLTCRVFHVSGIIPACVFLMYGRDCRQDRAALHKTDTGDGATTFGICARRPLCASAGGRGQHAHRTHEIAQTHRTHAQHDGWSWSGCHFGHVGTDIRQHFRNSNFVKASPVSHKSAQILPRSEFGRTTSGFVERTPSSGEERRTTLFDTGSNLPKLRPNSTKLGRIRQRSAKLARNWPNLAMFGQTLP